MNQATQEAGENSPPRDGVRLMANLVFPPVADGIQSRTYRFYCGACGAQPSTLSHDALPAGEFELLLSKPSRPRAEIRGDILAVQDEAGDLLNEMLEGAEQ